jgi:hypothetical protein
MRVFLWTFLALCIVANQSDAKDVVGLRHRLQDETEAPTPAATEDVDLTLGAGDEDETPAPTANVDGEGVDQTPVPPGVAGEETPAPTPVTPGDDQTSAAPTAAGEGGDETTEPPTEPPAEDVISPSPTPARDDARPTTNEPYEVPTYTPPVDPPAMPYVAEDDDPLQPVTDFSGDDDGDWQWKDSSVEDLEHDRTALIALSVVFGVGLLLAIITANQMLDNPDGLCARYVVR